MCHHANSVKVGVEFRAISSRRKRREYDRLRPRLPEMVCLVQRVPYLRSSFDGTEHLLERFLFVKCGKRDCPLARRQVERDVHSICSSDIQHETNILKTFSCNTV